VVVVDYGVGNLRNVYKALEAIGADAQVIDHPAGLVGAAGVVLPGVGAFGDAARNLRLAGFEEPLHAVMEDGVPLLGICVGMQLLFDESEEMGRHLGLGIIPGRVVRFAADRVDRRGRPMKVPQIGWNQLRHDGSDPLLTGVQDAAYAYFVHSYYCVPNAAGDTVAQTEYGLDYPSVVRRRSVWGIQCHPEKSQQVGLSILRNFAALVQQEARA
jgi:glutamine amidotransferase